VSDPKPSPIPLPPALANALARARTWLSALSRPARVLLFSTIGLTAVFGALVALKVANPTYAVLFSQLEREDAAALVAKLKELKTPYRLSNDGSAIEVPEAMVHELRLDLASAGLPRGGGVGFESFDKMRLGATDFEQHVLYRRALEGELSRTIGTLGAVQSARVHLVLPERSIFVARAEPASASLVVKLHGGRTLGASEIAGIVHLTAASVPGLTPDRVALVTTEGAMLHKPRPVAQDGETSAGDSDGLSEARAIEVPLEERTRSMLEKVVGVGHVDVRITADVDLARVERVEDRYDPLKSALRSEEVTIDRVRGTVDEGVAGVPGAVSNLQGPAGASDAGAPVRADAGAAKEAPAHEQRTRNYELDHVTERRTSTRGTLRRLAVAVMLDGVPKTENGKTTSVPRSKEEIDRIAALVRSAVGANDERGDVVTIDSLPFADTEAAPEPVLAPPPSILSKVDWHNRKVQIGAGVPAALLFLLVSLGAARLLRPKKGRPLPETSALALVGSSVASLGAPVIEEALSPAEMREAARRAAAGDPATAALVIQHWLGTGEAEAPLPPAGT
jgi:flagellar M-ring protein FliF